MCTTHIYIYTFSRRFYPKRLTVHSGYIFVLSVCVCNTSVSLWTKFYFCVLGHFSINSEIYVGCCEKSLQQIWENKNTTQRCIMAFELIYSTENMSLYRVPEHSYYRKSKEWPNKVKQDRQKRKWPFLHTSGGCWSFKEGKLIFGQHHKNVPFIYT